MARSRSEEAGTACCKGGLSGIGIAGGFAQGCKSVGGAALSGRQAFGGAGLLKVKSVEGESLRGQPCAHAGRFLSAHAHVGAGRRSRVCRAHCFDTETFPVVILEHFR